jgi:hypothetical protein
MLARGQKAPIVITAIARELLGFIWAIAQQVEPKDDCRVTRDTIKAAARAPAPVKGSSGNFRSGTTDLRESDRGPPTTKAPYAVSNPRMRNGSTVEITPAS